MNVETIYENAFAAIDTPAIRLQARELVDLGLCPVIISPSREIITDDNGRSKQILTIGKSQPILAGLRRHFITMWNQRVFPRAAI